jgi:transcription termination/antitermination protein NusG
MNDDDSAGRWFVLTVPTQHEIAVKERLETKGYTVSVPTCQVRRRWSDRVKTIVLPLFPGYVFCQFKAEERLPVLSTFGVRGAICFGGQLAALDNADVERVQRMADSGLHLQSLEGLRNGMRVKILAGPLSGMEGVLSHIQGSARVVVNVSLLNRSVAVHVAPDIVAPLVSQPMTATA